MVLGDHIYAKITAINSYGDSFESEPGDGAAVVFLPDAPINLANNAAITSATTVGLTWQEGVSNGGKPILDYKVWYDQGTSSYVALTTVTSESYTATGLTPGNTYKFKVQSRNSVGYSTYSNEVSVLAAQVPDQPATPTTTVSFETVVVVFSAPYNGGSTITEYQILIRQSDGSTYSQDLTDCNGADSTIIQTRRCTIPFDTLRAAPFSLPWGSSIYAKIVATNIMGNSLNSIAGNGAKITREPDPPMNLVTNTLVSNAERIGIIWDNGPESGGVPVLDYRVWYDKGISSFEILDYEILDTSYTTEVPLTAGTFYTFKI